MRKITCIILILPIIFLAFGCGSGKKMVEEDNIPEWYANTPQDPDYYYSTNSATSAKMQLAVDKAKVGARRNIAQQIEVKVQSLTKSFQEEIGSGEETELNEFFNQTMKVISSQTLNGSTTKKTDIQKEGTIYRAYVLMELPKISLESNLVNSVKKKNLYERFRASQAFQEMEKDVKKYENFKKNQENN